MLDVLVRTPAGKVARRGLPIFRGKNGAPNVYKEYFFLRNVKCARIFFVA